MQRLTLQPRCLSRTSCSSRACGELDVLRISSKQSLICEIGTVSTDLGRHLTSVLDRVKLFALSLVYLLGVSCFQCRPNSAMETLRQTPLAHREVYIPSQLQLIGNGLEMSMRCQHSVFLVWRAMKAAMNCFLTDQIQSN